MAIVAKTVLVYASVEDRETARTTIPWSNYLQIVGDGGHDDFTVVGTAGLDPSELGPNHLTVTRKWENKKNAEDFVEWMTAQLSTFSVVPVSFTVEDYTE